MISSNLLRMFQVSFRVSRVFRMFVRVLQGVFKESFKGVPRRLLYWISDTRT